MSIYKFTLLVFLFFISCQNSSKQNIEQLTSKIKNQVSEIKGDVAVAFLDLEDETNSVFLNVDEKFHAASTMKIPVMIELFKQQSEGKINLNDSILLKNEFKSIVDGSLYTMDIGEDSDDVIYSKINTKQKISDLMYNMVTLSSNLATNILIEIVDAKKTTQTMASLGANNMKVLRGVEDIKAYKLGLSNSTTAKDLLIIMKALAKEKAGLKEDCNRMIAILKEQKWNDMIPKYLPKNLEIAHKTGSITGVHHDAAIVYLPNGKKYVLVLLSKNLKDFDKGTDQLAKISKSIYDFVSQ
ncbi:serine hydrolase [Polaribacter sp. Z022]|uniref:serine hydrolase n=1 Tax=Polaribacter sp. Z022 TaxID=2927125 RepID=UPI002022275D|nr:serine hydrolase [Polaribacter sp. Z022]MCL7754442.1 class A beta-lactamase-related serine hydrolase [Polaribacter sp. Z022]